MSTEKAKTEIKAAMHNLLNFPCENPPVNDCNYNFDELEKNEDIDNASFFIRHTFLQLQEALKELN